MSLDLCPDCIGSVVGQASFLIHISQKYLPIFSLRNQNWDEAGVISHKEIGEKCEMDAISGWWGDEAFAFHGPVNWGEAGGQIYTQSCAGLITHLFT